MSLEYKPLQIILSPPHHSLRTAILNFSLSSVSCELAALTPLNLTSSGLA